MQHIKISQHLAESQQKLRSSFNEFKDQLGILSQLVSQVHFSAYNQAFCLLKEKEITGRNKSIEP